MGFDGSDGDGTKSRPRKMTFKEHVTFRRNHDQRGCLRVGEDEPAASKTLIEFVALIIRNKIYTYLLDEKKKLAKSPNFMSVPASIRELDKIEMVRQLDGVYRLDHAVTATQKAILKAFNLTDAYVKYVADEIRLKLMAEKQEG